MLTAIVREVSPRLSECLVSFQERAPIDVELAGRQHAEYCSVLAELGAKVVTLPALDDQPDCVFVEDPIVVLDEVAIVTRMGAETRRGESASLAAAVGRYRELLEIGAPGQLEGGDVMRIGKTLYVGISGRTNIAGLQQLAQLTAPFGYWVVPVEVRGCLHLKSACCYLGHDTVLANREWLDMDAFCGVKFLDAPEAGGANALRVGDGVVMGAEYPETARVVEARGFTVRTVGISELVKADAGVTCMSVVFEG
ncbi:MAG: arginine deiminase family protein [Bryobacteraceae bacterium]